MVLKHSINAARLNAGVLNGRSVFMTEGAVKELSLSAAECEEVIRCAGGLRTKVLDDDCICIVESREGGDAKQVRPSLFLKVDSLCSEHL
jgi:hypothetical protein